MIDPWRRRLAPTDTSTLNTGITGIDTSTLNTP